MTKTIAQLYDLSGKTAIVTGGGMGLGQAIALRLAEACASVVVTDINLEVANETVELIRQRGGQAKAIRADASSADDARSAVQQTVEAFGRLDILVNNAGIFPAAPTLEATAELWDHVLAVNLKGVFFYSQAAAKKMIEGGHGGKIVNIASIDALHPSRNLAHYVASNGGVAMLTKSLGLEFARHQINVNAIAPGGVITPGAEKQGEQILKATGISREQFLKSYVSRIPLGRMGEPDDVATVALFLASDAANFMTGALLVVDGGYLLS